MKREGKRLTLTVGEAAGLKHWLELQATRLVDQAYSAGDYIPPGVLLAIAEALEPAHTIKVSE